MSESKHTPLPWNACGGSKCQCGMIWGNDNHIVTVTKVDPAEAEANTAFIVRACNSHYDLLEACQAAVAERTSPFWIPRVTECLQAAIAKATKGDNPQ